MKVVIAVIGVVVIIAAGFWFFGPEDGDQTEVGQTEVQEEVVNDEELTGGEEAVSEVDLTAGFYGDYREDRLTMAEDGRVVLFFRASWCPSCRALDQDIQANLDQIPEDLTILTLDYDTEIDLRRQYGVTIQHTLVQVDAEGNKVQKWSGGNTLESITSRLD